MSLKDAERTLKGLGKTVKQNAPGPKELGGAAKELFWGPLGLIWCVIIFLLLFGDSIMYWLVHD